MAKKRVWDDSSSYNHKYIVDISGQMPTILLEMDPSDGMKVKKLYMYANGEILMQHNGNHTAEKYFYLHDRLGSVRMLIDNTGAVKNNYAYKPFGELLTAETAETTENPFKFTGQYYDAEIGQYYLRARQYDPALFRFTSRDPVFGQFKEPITLHKYLYCLNEPVNRVDPLGLDYFDFGFTYTPVGLVQGAAAGSLGGPLGFALGVAEGGFGFTGGLMWEAGLSHKPARVASTHPYFGFSWSASPMPSVTSTLTYSSQGIPTKEEGTTGWQVAATFSWGRAAYQTGMDLDTGKRFEEKGISVGTTAVGVPLSVSMFYAFGDFTYDTDDDLDRAVMLGEMLNDKPSFLGLQQTYLLMGGWLDETTTSRFRNAAEYQR